VRGTTEAGLVAAAAAGDESAFAALAERHRRELQVHCYRMTGSLEESEDLVQETFLRAWRGRRGFRGRSSLRTWLYRIATNACLDVLQRRPRRVLAADVAAADPTTTDLGEADLLWLQPYPDDLLVEIPDEAAGPVAAAEAKETIELAFMAAIQHLPPRQRAVLILRDALGWSARETARLMETSVAAANSALQRARATLQERLPAARSDWGRAPGAGATERDLLRRYIEAMESADIDGLVAMLAADARMTMPPYPTWFAGARAIADFHAATVWAGGRAYRHVATRANRQPAAAVYMRAPDDDAFRPLAIDVLRVDAGRVAEINAFVLPELFPRFGLPPER
jgi:RNA polymerase sigma-70 factor, ECF subfamily